MTTRKHRNDGGEGKARPPEELKHISLKSVAELLDTSRSSARRWLGEAGVQPVAVGRGRKGAIRYRWPEVRKWVESLKKTE